MKLSLYADNMILCISSVQFSCSVMSDSLQAHELQHARPPCPSPTPRVHPNSCPLSQWWHPAISSSVVPFSSCPQSLPASRSFPVSQPFTWGGQRIGVSALASVLPMNTQDWLSSNSPWFSFKFLTGSCFSSWNHSLRQHWCCQQTAIIFRLLCLREKDFCTTLSSESFWKR